MKVLFIATYAGLSGANQSLISMIKHLKMKGIKPLVIFPNNGPLEKLLIDEMIPYKKIRLFNWIIKAEKYNSLKERIKWIVKKIINMFQEIRIFLLIKSEKIDLLHINAVTASWGIHASKLNGTPVVWHIREFMEEDLDKRFWNKKRAIKLLNKSDYVIAISDSVKNKYENIINDTNLVRIYNGVDLGHYSNIKNKIFSKGNIILTLAGRIVPEKGHEDVIYALEHLTKNNYSMVRVRFVGEEGDESFILKLKELIKELDIVNFVEFLGFRKDMYNIWADTDIALICSKAEAFGRVTVEAMMAGALVIGSNTGATPEIIANEYGLIYEQGNYLSLADKIKYAIDHKREMEIIAFNGQEYATKKFTARKNAENVFKIYTEISRQKNLVNRGFK